VLVPAALAWVLWLRATGPSGDKTRGFEEVMATAAKVADGRALVLLRPTETLAGAASFYVDRTVPEVHSDAELLEARRAAGRLDLVVLSARERGPTEEVLGPARLAHVDRRSRRVGVLSILVFPPGNAPAKGPM
jgi:hypothetical protein